MEMGASREGGTRLTWHVPLEPTVAAEVFGTTSAGLTIGTSRPAVRARTEQTSAKPSSTQPASFALSGTAAVSAVMVTRGGMGRGHQRHVESGAGRRRDGVDALDSGSGYRTSNGGPGTFVMQKSLPSSIDPHTLRAIGAGSALRPFCEHVAQHKSRVRSSTTP